MEQKIFKYAIKHDEFEIMMPRGAQILTVQTQKTKAYMWALVDPKAELARRVFRLAVTGHTIDDDNGTASCRHIGTFQLYGGDIVFHLFEIISFVEKHPK